MSPFRIIRPRDLRAAYTPSFDQEPKADLDWVVVERTITGEHPQPFELTTAEKREAALWLIRHGWSRQEVSVRVSVYARLIKEWEAEAGLLDPGSLCRRQGCTNAVSGHGLCANCLCKQRNRERAQARMTEAA